MRLVVLDTVSPETIVLLAALVGLAGAVTLLCTDPCSVQRWSTWAAWAGLRTVRPVAGTLSHTGLPAGQADAFLCLAQAPPADPQAAAELLRVLRPGGWFAAVWPAAWSSTCFDHLRGAAQRALAVSLSPAPAPVSPDGDRVGRVLRRAGWSRLQQAHTSVSLEVPDAVVAERLIFGPSGPWRLDLSHLPWAARRTAEDTLREALASALDQMPPVQRSLTWDLQLVHAHKPSRPREERLDIGARVTVSLQTQRVFVGRRLLLRAPSRGRILTALAQAHSPLSAAALAVRAGGCSLQTVYNAIRDLRAQLPDPLRIEHAPDGYVLRRTG